MPLPVQVLALIADEQTLQNGGFVPNDESFLLKLEEKAELLTHTENGKCSGFVFFYCNDPHKISSYITLIMTAQFARKKGIGTSLAKYVLNITKARGFSCCHLEVKKDNISAFSLYKSLGFEIIEDRGEKLLMRAEA